MTFLVSSVNSLKCLSISNQECKTTVEVIDIESNKPIIYPYSIIVNKCKGSCNGINDPYENLCALDTLKTIHVKVFDLVSRINETRHIEWHSTCKCKSRLDASVYNNKQR